jgi:hypothetical protein
MVEKQILSLLVEKIRLLPAAVNKQKYQNL